MIIAASRSLVASEDSRESIGQSQSTFNYLSTFFAVKNLFSVTVGNMVGGALVGLTYWFIYLRRRRPR